MNIDRIISMVINQIVRRFVGSGINAVFKYGGSKFGPKSSGQESAPVAAPRPANESPAVDASADVDATIDSDIDYRPITDAEREGQLAGKDLGSRAKTTAKLGRRMGRF